MERTEIEVLTPCQSKDNGLSINGPMFWEPIAMSLENYSRLYMYNPSRDREHWDYLENLDSKVSVALIEEARRRTKQNDK
jgi:hypothetical protein